MNQPALEIRDLKKRYGKLHALDGLNLTVPEGSVFGLVGPNGAGKTTTFSIAAGLLKADSGSLNVLGNGPFDPVTHKGLLSLLPQDSQIPGHSRVRECLVYFAKLQGLSRRDALKSADAMLDWVDLRERARSPLRTLSHGMFRRLTVAQAFLGSPKLVLLDEPTSGLDPQQVVKIRSLIQSQRNSQTIIISSHILSEIEAVCDHVAFIDHGRTTRQDSMDAVILKSHQMTISVNTGSVPMNDLRTAVPAAEFDFDAESRQLVLRIAEGTMDPADINARILPVLLQHRVGILEIVHGSDLESAYLNQRTTPDGSITTESG